MELRLQSVCFQELLSPSSMLPFLPPVSRASLQRSGRQGETAGLPYGWEEAYTADGVKYYINHVTQTTSWSPPGSSGGAPELTPPPQETSEVGEGCDGEAVKQRQNPTAEMKM
ncbi:transcriptional coactivator YAP1-A-like isoform X1 [Simochromis diagramma]|uniref:transcriptional coactivator YAP1-A-like isoform X1 n=1 Tax=Simochromis diagramma TaxID=43689 RepID=UPI001A7E77B5|nr:transcriptional coactivator YAP1-A-like isoform X1 [Simochromis diagramma]